MWVIFPTNDWTLNSCFNILGVSYFSLIWFGKMRKFALKKFKKPEKDPLCCDSRNFLSSVVQLLFVCLCFSAHKPSCLSTFAYKEPSYSLRLTYVCGEELDQVSSKYNITVLVDWESDGNLKFSQKNRMWNHIIFK